MNLINKVSFKVLNFILIFLAIGALLSLPLINIVSTASADEEIPAATSTPTPSISPSPSETPQPTVSPTPTPTETPEPTPSVTPEPSTTPTPGPTADPSSTPSPSSTPTPSTTPSPTPAPVVVGTTYGGPNGSKVKFNSITGTAGTLTISQASLSSSQVTQLKALTSTVYDISSSMPNGSFTYDLTLPLPAGVSGTNFKVKYAETVNGLSSAQTVSENIALNGDGTFTIHNLNHFTVFVVTDPNDQASCDAIYVGASCYQTIQEAVDAAAADSSTGPHEIRIAAGTYNETVNVNTSIDFTGVNGTVTVDTMNILVSPVTFTNVNVTHANYPDTQAPVISNIQLSKSSVKNGNVLTITATVSDNNQGLITASMITADLTGLGLANNVAASSYNSTTGVATWNITVASTENGVITITINAQDAMGNNATSQTTNITLDNSAPAIATNLKINNSTNPSAIGASGQTTVSISGTGEAGTTANWTITDGTNSVTGSVTIGSDGTFSVSNINVSTLADGILAYKVTVTDTAGNTCSVCSTPTLNVTKDTVAPIVSAGTDKTKKTSFTQDATVSDSTPSSGGLTYQWSKISGPGTATFGSATSEDTTISVNTDGSYVIQLTVTDAAGNSSSSSFILIWDSVAPTVSAGTDKNKKASFTQDATASDTTPSSGGLTYTWSKVSGPTGGTITFGSATSEDTTISADTDGAYVLQLTVTDAAGNSTTSTFNLVWDTVVPTVNAGSTTNAKTSFTTSATASDPIPSSAVATYLWTKISGPAGGAITFGTATTLNTTISADTDGVYVIQLTVTDNAGNSTSSTFTLNWDTVAPTVSAGSNITTKILSTTTATATDSVPSSGITTYAWTQVSGPTGGVVTFGTASALNTSVSANVDGTYVLKLTVTDAAGNSSSSTINLIWDTVAPTVNAGSNTSKKAGFTTASTVSDPTPSSGGLTYAWIKQSGPTGGVVTFGTSTTQDTTISADTDGAYVIRLTVTDAAGNSSYSEFTLNWDTVAPTVLAGSNQAKKASFTQTGSATDSTPSSEGLTYTWSLFSGPVGGVITFGSSTSLSTTISANIDGSYVITLTVTDAAGNSASSTFTLDWDTQAPTISAGTDQLKKALFTQTGTAVDPTPSSGSLTYAWVQVSGPLGGIITFGSANTLTPNISASLDGNYVIALVVTDAAGNFSTSSFTLTWDTTNPTSSWTTPTNNSTVSGSVNLSATTSDTNGIASITFLYRRNDGVDTFHTISTFNNSPVVVASTLTTTWITSGLALDNYTLRIIVTDAAGNSTTVDQIVGLATVISPSSIQGNNVSKDGIEITWTTADLTSSRVIFDTISHSGLGSAPNYGYAFSSDLFDLLKVLNHKVILSGLNSNTKYFYRVISAGSPEAVSQEFSFTTPVIPQPGILEPIHVWYNTSAPVCTDTKPGSAPALLSAKVSGRKVTLIWSKAKDPVTYYLIEYGTGHDKYQFGIPNVGNVTQFEIGDLTPGITYYFRVRGGNNCAPGEFSNELQATAQVSGVSAFAETVVNVASRVLGATDVQAAESDENSSILPSEATSSSQMDQEASSTSRISPSPAVSAKKAGGLSNILILSGLIILGAGTVAYYRSLQKKTP